MAGILLNPGSLGTKSQLIQGFWIWMHNLGAGLITSRPLCNTKSFPSESPGTSVTNLKKLTSLGWPHKTHWCPSPGGLSWVTRGHYQILKDHVPWPKAWGVGRWVRYSGCAQGLVWTWASQDTDPVRCVSHPCCPAYSGSRSWLNEWLKELEETGKKRHPCISFITHMYLIPQAESYRYYEMEWRSEGKRVLQEHGSEISWRMWWV